MRPRSKWEQKKIDRLISWRQGFSIFTTPAGSYEAYTKEMPAADTGRRLAFRVKFNCNKSAKK